MTTLSGALASILQYTIIRHWYLDEKLNLSFELLVDWNEKYNHDLGDCFPCTVPFLVHELALSNRSSEVVMTDFAQSEGRNKLESCFSDLIFLPTDHSLRLIYSRKSSFKENEIGLILAPWLCPCAARMQIIVELWSKTTFWVCRQNDWVRQSTSPCFNFWVCSACLSKHDPIVLLRRVHDNLYVVRSSWGVLEMLTNSQSLSVSAFAGIDFQIRWLKPVDISFGFVAALNLTGECLPVTYARGRPQFIDCCDD